MPRANRHYVTGHIWHLTHRCHGRQFLLRFRHDRNRWLYWLSQARRRHRLRVLNYIVTCNHIHLLVMDQGNGEIARSMQLIAGRTAQEYNKRKGRRGAYWEDRYHATAVSTDHHLIACMRYIDLNMVRAGVVRHPDQWQESGFHAIQHPRQRYGTIDLPVVVDLLGCPSVSALQVMLRKQVESVLRAGTMRREAIWSESVAIGSKGFVEAFKGSLDRRSGKRFVVTAECGDMTLHALREAPEVVYGAK
jgi:putative transposase